ncbi:hypothetical protein FPR_28180 [Faecalibacterium prausnitzii SL3/3]|uniref:Uncharacterized protein n=1 Tax=Faecalibacterium prausnitzii SL3/3 TaxID=657322 RepID=D4K5R4_9FIRM|nr:hypothetical protein FPR_28180 [Faecalibacterium prausnitzii SL3/3]
MHCFAPPVSPLFVGKCAHTPSGFAPEGVSIKNPPALFVQRDILFL